MTARQLIALFLVAVAFPILGALFKVQHWPLASFFMIVSSAVQAVALILLAMKVLATPASRTFWTVDVGVGRGTRLPCFVMPGLTRHRERQGPRSRCSPWRDAGSGPA